MNVYICQREGNWACIVDGKLHVLKVPVERRLVAVVRAILHHYPQAFITIGSESTANPFVQYEMKQSSFHGWSYDWNRLSEAFEHIDCLVCMRCGGPSWWDPGVSGFHCMKCNAKGDIVSRLKYIPAGIKGGWEDADAFLPKPTEACRCGTNDPGWYKPSARWICRACGNLLPKVKVTALAIPF